MHNGRENSSRKGWRVRRDYPLACHPIASGYRSSSLIFDERDVIFAVDGERMRTFLSLRTEYKVLRAAIACISRSQDEGDEFKSV